jgi:hypothetical protein
MLLTTKIKLKQLVLMNMIFNTENTMNLSESLLVDKELFSGEQR